MLLSSVNFVAKPKHGKPKVKEAHKEPINEETGDDVECEQCKIETKRSRTYFRFPSVRASSEDSFRESGYASLGDNESISHNDDSSSCPRGDRVTIGTGDEYCISVDPFFYTICMAEARRCDSTCIFRKRILHTEERTNGRTETVVFHLDCDRDHYLTTNKARQLELNYCSETAMRSTPDERFFQIYHTPLGQTFIQPYHHKGYYFHHLDAQLAVEQLDLNWRAPEEFYFDINYVPENSPIEPEYKECTHSQEINQEKKHKDTQKHINNPDAHNTSKQKKHKDIRKHTNDSDAHNSSKKTVEKTSPQSVPRCDVGALKRRELINSKHKVQKYNNSHFLSQLFLGCFTDRSRTYTQSEV